MLEMIRDLYSHMAWADERVWRLILSDDEIREKSGALEVLLHLHNTQHAFLDLWNGRRVRQREPEEFPDSNAMATWAREFHAQVMPWIDDLSMDHLGDELRIPWAHFFREVLGCEPAQVTIGQSLIQVAMHSVHHRAQVSSRVRTAGGEPPIIDYIGWLWMARPEVVWEVT